MAIESWGYPGVIAPGLVWAQMQWGMGKRWYVYNASHIRCSPVAGGIRNVLISAGHFGGWGIHDQLTEEMTLQLPNPASGTHYYMLVAKRTWDTANVTTFEWIDAGTVLPSSLPSRATSPGVEDDQPLWLVPMTAGQNVPGTPIDLRLIGTEGGCMQANHALVLTYAGYEGIEIALGTSIWRRGSTVSGAQVWFEDTGAAVRRALTAETAFLTLASGWSKVPGGGEVIRANRDGNHVDLSIMVKRTGGTIVAGNNDGNFSNTKIGNVTAAWRPTRPRPFAFIYENGAYGGHGYVDPNGDVILVSGTASHDIVQKTTASTQYSVLIGIDFLQESAS